MADGDDVISDGVEGEGLTMTSSVPAATNQCRGFETIGPVRISSSWTDQSMIVIFFWATLFGETDRQRQSKGIDLIEKEWSRLWKREGTE